MEAALRPQPWPWTGPRVLIEHGEKERAYAIAAAFRSAGYSVAVCAGPAAGDPCPLAGDDGCAIAQVANLIVSSLGVATPEAREALVALRTRIPSVPLLVEIEDGAAAEWPELLDGCETVAPGSPEQLVEHARALLAPEAVHVA